LRQATGGLPDAVALPDQAGARALQVPVRLRPRLVRRRGALNVVRRERRAGAGDGGVDDGGEQGGKSADRDRAQARRRSLRQAGHGRVLAEDERRDEVDELDAPGDAKGGRVQPVGVAAVVSDTGAHGHGRPALLQPVRQLRRAELQEQAPELPLPRRPKSARGEEADADEGVDGDAV
jgi:hypothetical protein